MSVIRNLLFNQVSTPTLDINFSNESKTLTDYVLDFMAESAVFNAVSVLETTLNSVSMRINEQTAFNMEIPTTFTTFNGKIDRTLPLILFLDTRGMDSLELSYPDPDNLSTSITENLYLGLNVIDIPSTVKKCTIKGTTSTAVWLSLEQYPYSGDIASVVYNGKKALKDVELSVKNGYSLIAQYVNSESYSLIYGTTYSTGDDSTVDFDISGKEDSLTILNDGAETTFGCTHLIGNSHEALAYPEDIIELNKGSKEYTYQDLILSNNNVSYISRIVFWNRLLSINSIKDWYEKNCIPMPKVYYDIDKQRLIGGHTTGKPYFIDFSGNGNHAEGQNFEYISSNWVNNPWKYDNTLIECEEVSQGVFHVTKLLKKDGNSSSIMFKVELENFNGYCSNASIFINKPSTRETLPQTSFYMGDSSFTNTIVSKDLVENINMVDIPPKTKFNSESTNIAGIVFSDDWYDHDADGNNIDTVIDFYVIFLPVYDDNNRVGYPEYGLSSFDSWVADNGTGAKILNYYSAENYETGDLNYLWALNQQTYINLITPNILIIRPFKARFKAPRGIAFYRDLHAKTNDDDVFLGSFYPKYTSNGELYIIDDPGDVIFVDTPEKYISYNTTFFGSKYGRYEQLGADPSFKFPKGRNTITNLYIGALMPESEQYGTVIMDVVPSSDVLEGVRTISLYRGYSDRSGVNIQMRGPDSEEGAMGEEIAFTHNNVGKTYINGILNTTHKVSEYLDKRVTIAVIGTPSETPSVHWIGATDTGGESPFKLYKFMAFREQLTEEQLNKVLDKYGFYKGE